ncbi:MAG: DUF4279 domain-containing protein [Eubacteriales bacterium]|nr:DUF4279 domain-containing protein [Eubacteriales bacterium]
MNNRCYTYFRIVGKFNTDDISHILKLTPEKKWDIGDVRPKGSKYNFANWAIGYCKDYNIDTSVQMEKTISILMDKKEELKQIREKNDVEFFLQVVPTLCIDESTPALAPSMAVMDFCYETRTEIDIDLYLED